MLDKKVVELLNQQVNKEFYSAYLYLDFSNYYYNEGLDGFGNWYKIQAQEERDHAMLFIQYLQNNGEQVVLEAIDKPQIDLTSAKAVLAEGLKHEQYVTCLLYTSSIELTEAAKNYVVEGGYDPMYGARPLKRYLQKNVETQAARLILAGDVGRGDCILIDVVDGKLEPRVKK